MMVECEAGVEERSMTGSLKASTQVKPGAETAAAANTGSSYFNKQEAILAVRCVPLTFQNVQSLKDSN